MKLRAYAPAVLGLAALVALYVLVKRDRDEPQAPQAPQAQAHSHSHSHEPTPAAPGARVPGAPALPGTQATPPTPPPAPPRALTPEEYAGHEPKANKPKMNDEEKIAETKKHIDVMERRVQLLEVEIADLDKRGEKEKATAQRVILERLKKHAAQLREDVAAGRAPK